jgi:hypothetical protein
MEILSKDTIALLDNEKVREAIDEMLDDNGPNERVVTVPKSGIIECKSDDNKGDQTSDNVRVVKLRRLSV